MAGPTELYGIIIGAENIFNTMIIGKSYFINDPVLCQCAVIGNPWYA